MFTARVSDVERRSMLLIGTLMLVFLAGPGVPSGMAQRSRRRAPDQSPYASVASSLVLITAGGGRVSGTGFIWLVDGKKYLVTNEHVIRGGRPLSARLLDGRDVELSAMDLAGDRDLVRFKMAAGDPAPGLACAADQSLIGDGVWVFGNSDGGDVITREHGKILGVGPDRVEVDTPFVRGNSGSPIVNEHGHVLGVATYATQRNDPDDWINSGTRYGEVRRFGLTLGDIEWVSMAPEAYWTRADALRDIAIYSEDLRQLYSAGFFDIAVTTIRYDFDTRQRDYAVYKELSQSLDNSVRARNQIITRLDRAVAAYHEAGQSRSRSGRSMSAEHDLDWQLRMMERERQNLWDAFDRSMREGIRLLDHDHWMLPSLKREADTLLSYLQYIHRHYENAR